MEEKVLLTKKDQDGQPQAELKKKVNVYLSSSMLKVPDHVYALG
jgi:hypothetical protein